MDIFFPKFGKAKWVKIHSRKKELVCYNAQRYIIDSMRYSARNVNQKNEGRIMDQSLSKRTQPVRDFLKEAGLDHVVLDLPTSARTAVEAASGIGCDVSQIVKSLIFKTKATEKPVLILVSGSNRVNEKQIECHLGEKITKADADFTRDITGYVIGGIPPLAHKHSIELIFVDQDLLKFEEVWAAAGTATSVFRIQQKDLLSVVGGKVIQVC